MHDFLEVGRVVEGVEMGLVEVDVDVEVGEGRGRRGGMMLDVRDLGIFVVLGGEFSTDDIQRGQRDAEFALPFAAFTTAAAAHDWQSFTRKYARRRYSYAAATLSTTTADDTKHFE